MAAPVPATSSPTSTNGPPISAAAASAAAAAPTRVAQRDGGNTSLGTFGVRLRSPHAPLHLHVPQVKSGLAQMLKVHSFPHPFSCPYHLLTNDLAIR